MAFGKTNVRRTRVMMTAEAVKRRKHLKDHLATYERVFDRLFAVMDQVADLDVHVFKVLYFPRARILKIGLAWRDGAYPRRHGFFMLWRGGIFDQGDMVVWPKVICRVPEWKPIGDLTDAAVDAQILTAIGAPWAGRLNSDVSVGALQHDTRLLVRTAKSLKLVPQGQHQYEIEDLVRRIEGLAGRMGINHSIFEAGVD